MTGVTKEMFITHAQLAGEIVHVLEKGQSISWYYEMVPKVEKLLKKYSHRLEKLDG